MEFENLAKQYLTYLIKQECWDSMEVKGRSIEVGESDDKLTADLLYDQ